MKKILMLLVLSIAFCASLPTVPHEFESRKIIPANWLNDNFDSANNAVTDGTSKINVAEIEINGSTLIDDSKVLSISGFDVTGDIGVDGTATIGDVEATNIKSASLIVRGDSYLSNEHINNTLSSWSSNNVTISASGSSIIGTYVSGYGKMTIPLSELIIGDTYTFNLDYETKVAGSICNIYRNNNTGFNEVSQTLTTPSGNLTVTFDAVVSDYTLSIDGGTGSIVTVNSVSVTTGEDSLIVIGTANIENIDADIIRVDSIFNNWEYDSYAEGVNYYATSDMIVVAFVGQASVPEFVRCYVSTTSNPTLEIANMSLSTTINKGTCTFPVKNNYYWRVDVVNGTTNKISAMTFGGN